MKERATPKEIIIVSIIIVALLGLLSGLMVRALQDEVFEYDRQDKYKMTNCIFIKRGNAIENTWYDVNMEKEVVCDEGTFTHWEYETQYTLIEAQQFRELLEDILNE